MGEICSSNYKTKCTNVFQPPWFFKESIENYIILLLGLIPSFLSNELLFIVDQVCVRSKIIKQIKFVHRADATPLIHLFEC